MRVQYFSDEYISETETVDLIEKVSEKYKDICINYICLFDYLFISS